MDVGRTKVGRDPPMDEAGSGGQETFRTKRQSADGNNPAGTKNQGDFADRRNRPNDAMKVLEK